jgi:hypothetical protein
MHPSNVKVSEETMQAAQAPLTFKRKQEIRRENIYAYIRSKPLGTRIKVEEFQAVGNFATVANAYAFLNVLIKHKLIYKDNITLRTYSYRVADDEAHVIKPANKAGTKAKAKDIESLAMEYSWQNHDVDSYNDLHKFIEWINNRELGKKENNETDNNS